MANNLRSPALDGHFTEGLVCWSDDDRGPGGHRRIFIEEVEGSEEESHRVPRGGSVRDVLRVGDVEEANSHPGHQVLKGKDEVGLENTSLCANIL